jgi:hypothetical protein
MKVKINVPENLSEITLDQYMRFLKLDFEANSKNSFVMQKMIEIFCNANLRDVADIRFSDVTMIVNQLQDIFNHESKMIPQISLNGVKYGFIPNLDDMSLGEYIDLDNYFHEWDTMDKAMCVLYRPIKYSKNGKYLVEDYEGTDNHMEMRQLPLNVVMGAKVFFYHLGIELLNHIPNFLEAEGMTDQQRQTLMQNGAGIQAFTDLVKAMLPNLTSSQD